jgi:tetratricopeptide (TPR) repeat protein
MAATRFSADEWRRLEEGFERIRAAAPEDRARRFAECADWPAALRDELRALLDAAEPGRGAALETPAVAALGFKLRGGNGAADWIGMTLGGRWRIEAAIASGGMGDVMRARRVVGDYEQVVAVKLLREGMQHGSLAARFRAERRALAALHHPHVAKLLDGGETEHGVPWFVMEFVEGENLLSWADARALDLRARVRLLLPICDALQHAHQRLIVHRDLKPGNILVTGSGEPVLLDFGVAKLLDPGEAGAELTRGARAPMTPEYASPEQARGEAVGTASDLWSLGVVMFRLFGGGKPYEVETVSGYDLAKRLSETRMPDVRERAPAVPADLAAIVGKCLRAEPERRYASAQALAEDLQRFLRGLPVAAQPDSFTYRARKFLRRNWAASALAATALVAAGAGAAGIVWQRNLAVQRALTAQRVTAFLVGLFQAPDPWAESLGQQSLEQILASGRRGLVEGLRDEPAVRRELLAALGEVYRNLGAEEDAITILGEALAADPELRRRDPARWADLSFVLGVAHLRNADLAGAEDTLRAVLAARRAGGGDEEALASALNTLGVVLAQREEGRHEAEGLYREALALRERLFGPDHEEVATTVQNLAALDLARGRVPEALAAFERAAEIFARAWPAGHPDRATELNNWGMALLDAGRAAEAEARLREGLVMRERLLPPDHPHVAGSRNNLGLVLFDAERYGEARAVWQTALDGIAARAREDHPLRALLLDNLAAAEEALQAAR